MIKKFDYDQIQKSTKDLQRLKLAESKILLAVSGGLDSVVLLDHMVEVQKKLPSLKLGIVYFHHGITRNKKTDAYRAKAQKFVSQLSQKYKIPFVTNKAQASKSRSEEELRDDRFNFFQKSLASNYDVIAMAHHADDQFETQLMRLVRGSGPQGFLGMSVLSENKLRPLLGWDRNDIELYASKKNLKWVEDPSNKEKDFFRNWIRKSWLKDLEAKRPGSCKAFKESLKLLSEALSTPSDPMEWIEEAKGIKREAFVFLNKAEKRTLLAYYFKFLCLKNYKTTHIDEVLKRLDSPQKILTFELLKCRWTIDTQHISAKPL